ncbi:MAG: hypothetical protein IPK64_20665 [bacterium]|nr:hypothetical protein [bacterium]
MTRTVIDATIYTDKPTPTGGTVYDRTDFGLMPGFTLCHYESRYWLTPGSPNHPDNFDATRFAAWAATVPSGVVRLLDFEGLFQRCDPRYNADGPAYAQSHPFWAALAAARTAQPGETWMIYGSVYGMNYPWLNPGDPAMARQIRRCWGPLSGAADTGVLAGEVPEEDMDYPAADLLTTTITSIGVRPIDLIDAVVVSCYVELPQSHVAEHPTHPGVIVRSEMAAAARYGKPLAPIFLDRFSPSGSQYVPLSALEDVFRAGMLSSGATGIPIMWSGPGRLYVNDAQRWRPAWDAAYQAWLGEGADGDVPVPYFIPPALNERDDARIIARVVGQYPARVALSRVVVGNTATVTARVVNFNGKRCAGLFSLRAVLGSTPDGGPGGDQAVTIEKGALVAEVAPGTVYDFLTASDGEASLVVTSTGDGGTWFRCEIRAVVEGIEIEADGDPLGGVTVGGGSDDGSEFGQDFMLM